MMAPTYRPSKGTFQLAPLSIFPHNFTAKQTAYRLTFRTQRRELNCSKLRRQIEHDAIKKTKTTLVLHFSRQSEAHICPHSPAPFFDVSFIKVNSDTWRLPGKGTLRPGPLPKDTYLNCAVIVWRWLKELEIVPRRHLHTTLCRTYCLINHEMISSICSVPGDPRTRTFLKWERYV